MIGRMAKPEEVLVVENDNGEVIREQFKECVETSSNQKQPDGKIFHVMGDCFPSKVMESFFSTLFQDTDSINLYKTMRETLVYLTHLDHKDTEQIMTQKLARQVCHNL